MELFAVMLSNDAVGMSEETLIRLLLLEQLDLGLHSALPAQTYLSQNLFFYVSFDRILALNVIITVYKLRSSIKDIIC